MLVLVEYGRHMEIDSREIREAAVSTIRRIEAALKGSIFG
jgi:hypothetical protein